MLRTPAGRYRCTMHHASIGKGVRMPVIALLNQKGGVGTTSTCHHLAGTLAASGRRVLLLDNDPQASLSQGFWGPIATAELDPAATIATLYTGPAPFPEQVIRPAGVPGIDLVPGSKHATRYNVPEPHATPYEVQHGLRSFLDGNVGRRARVRKGARVRKRTLALRARPSRRARRSSAH